MTSAPGTGPIRTPDQGLRVFVSSTLRELADERRAARSAIEKPHLAQSDVFVGVYGEKCGWVAPGEPVSGLEDEYRLTPAGMPRLRCVKGTGRDLPPRQQERNGRTYFSLLATVREYALEQLEQAGTPDTFRDRHARHSLSLADRMEAELAGAAQAAQATRSRSCATRTTTCGRRRGTCWRPATGTPSPGSPGRCSSAGGSAGSSARCAIGWTSCWSRATRCPTSREPSCSTRSTSSPTGVGRRSGSCAPLEEALALARSRVAAARGDFERAGRMLGAALTLREQTGFFQPPAYAFHTRLVEGLRAGPHADAFERGVTSGRMMSPQEVLGSELPASELVR